MQGVPKNQELEAICGDVSFVGGGHCYSEGDELLIPYYFRRNINLMLVQIQFFSPCYCIPTETTWCVQRAPYIHPLQIQKVESLGKHKHIPNLKVVNSLCWKIVKESTFDRKGFHFYPV